MGIIDGFSRKGGALIVLLLNIFRRSRLNWFCLESSSRFLEEEIYRRDGKKSFSSSVENNDLKSLCNSIEHLSDEFYIPATPCLATEIKDLKCKIDNFVTTKPEPLDYSKLDFTEFTTAYVKTVDAEFGCLIAIGH